MKFFSDDSHLGPLETVESKPVESTLRNAAAYVRMSTEHQQYSIANQLDVLREYAARHGWNIVKVYADEGRSGLNIAGRAALPQMISEVLTKKVNFAHILVYDVSRWGRFQDPDEAAHYEFICREAGVPVHYCAEPFDNNLSLASTIAKNLKRAMAGEYSRELSVKVFRGACRLVQLGYKQGGSAIYGLRRMLIDQHGQPKAILKRGEQKCLQTDRVVYMPGPEEEIKVVRWIFEAFVVEGLATPFSCLVSNAFNSSRCASGVSALAISMATDNGTVPLTAASNSRSSPARLSAVRFLMVLSLTSSLAAISWMLSPCSFSRSISWISSIGDGCRRAMFSTRLRSNLSSGETSTTMAGISL